MPDTIDYEIPSPKRRAGCYHYEINGITYITPKIPRKNHINGSSLQKDEQIFRRTELPDFMLSASINKDGDINWNKDQFEYIAREYDRCKRSGSWVMINGTPTYISPIYYFYLNYYTLENGVKPDYRDVDRRWFYYLEYCLSKGYIKGIIRLKKRREGATSQVCAWLIWTAIFFKNSKCGIVSKTDKDAFTAYTDMVLLAWDNMIEFLKPDHKHHTTKSISLKKQGANKNEIQNRVFLKKDGDEIGSSGMNSSISYRPTTMSSYTSGRITAGLIDESSQWEKINVFHYVPRVLRAATTGTKRVGFFILPTYMYDLNKGGQNFIDLYEASNQFKSESRRTQTGLYKYFVPAYDGYPGFIGKFGESIINKPSKKQLDWLIAKKEDDDDLTEEELALGAYGYLKSIRDSITNPELLKEAMRLDPFSEEEVLYEGRQSAYFNSFNLNSQSLRIKEEKPVIRKGILYEDENGNVRFSDNPSGDWHFLRFPGVEYQNKYRMMGAARIPMYPQIHKIGVDPFRNTKISMGSRGSNGTIVIGENFDSHNPGMPIGFYRGRHKLKSDFYKEVYMACRFASCRANIESDVDDFYEQFSRLKALGYASHTPKIAIDPQLDEKKRLSKQQERGVKSSDPFAMGKELELAQFYINNYSDNIWFEELVQDLLHYDHFNRTKSDLSVAFMMMLLDMAVPSFIEEKQKQSLTLDAFMQAYDLNTGRPVVADPRMKFINN